jgi:hypothetical protein
MGNGSARPDNRNFGGGFGGGLGGGLGAGLGARGFYHEGTKGTKFGSGCGEWVWGVGEGGWRKGGLVVWE